MSSSLYTSDDRMTKFGWMLFFCGILLTLSAFPELRVEVGRLQVHPINFVVPVVLLMGINRFRLIPQRIFIPLLLFAATFYAVTLTAPRGGPVALKLFASVATAIAAAIAVKSEGDFRAGVTAVLLSAAAISLRGLTIGDIDSIGGINPMKGIANKNAFSLYVLPPLLLGGHLLIRERMGRMLWLTTTATMLVTTFAVFTTRNRSGWLGIVVIATFLGVSSLRKARRALVVVGLILGATLLVDHYGNTELIEQRLAETEVAYKDDTLRIWLVTTSFEIGLDNPFVGVSPQGMPSELGLRAPDGASKSTHNVFATIFGGGGLLLSFVSFIVAAGFWSRPGYGPSLERGSARTAHNLLRAMVFLWCVRGLFSDEILYSQSFSMGLGLCVGLCICRGVWSPDHREVDAEDEAEEADGEELLRTVQ